MSKFLSCTNMTGGYGGEDIIHACDIEVDKIGRASCRERV